MLGGPTHSPPPLPQKGGYPLACAGPRFFLAIPHTKHSFSYRKSLCFVPCLRCQRTAAACSWSLLLQSQAAALPTLQWYQALPDVFLISALRLDFFMIPLLH